MQFANEEFKHQFYTTIREALPSDVTIQYICLMGSQAKNLASADSDYDVRVIITSPHKHYVLQRPHQAIRINTTFQGKELEGTAFDIIKAFEYALETNLTMVEILRGVPIYESSEKIFQQLKRVLLEAYLPTVTLNALQGKIYYYLKKHLKDKEGNFLEKVPAKVGVETLFLVLESRCVLMGNSLIEHSTIQMLRPFLEEEEAEWVMKLVETRRANKHQEIVITEDIKKMIQETLEKLQAAIKGFSKKETEKIHMKKQGLREEVDKLCLNMILTS